MAEIQEQRHICYDDDLGIEAYNLIGIVQKFPNHFHEYFVIGFMEGGKRHLCCGGQEYELCKNDLVLFNPRDSHFCAPVDGEILDYRALNISQQVMEHAVWEITGQRSFPHFTETIIRNSELASSVAEVYRGIVEKAPRLEKEEAFFFLLEQVLQDHAVYGGQRRQAEKDGEMQELCAYMEERFAENISLDQLVRMTRRSKSCLLRAFTKEFGISPYRYLQAVRIDKAKKFLEQGIPPAEAAAMAGFADQSHFSNFFKTFIGLTPKQYQRIFIRPKQNTGGTGMEEKGGK